MVSNPFFTFFPDPEWLELDMLPLSSLPAALREELLAHSGIRIAGPKGPPIAAEVRHSEGVLVGKGLGKRLASAVGSLSSACWDGTTLQVGPLPFIEEPGHRRPAVADRATPEQQLEGLLDLLARGHSEGERAFLSHARARSLLTRPGFDELLCLQVLPFTPFDYQVQTCTRVLTTMRGNALLCDEVGLGKTIEAGMILLEYVLRRLVRRVLILVPATLMEQWREEMRWKFNLAFVSQDDAAYAGTRRWLRAPYLLLSLQFARRRENALALEAENFDLVIVDEAHHLKNRETQSWKLVARLKKRFLLLLTATPVQNDLEELFNLVTLLRPGQLGTAREFRKRFVTASDPFSPRNAPQLRALMRQVMIRNRRSETGLDLPPRHAEVLALRLSPPEARFYAAVTGLVREAYAAGTVSPFVLKVLQQEVGSSVAAARATLRRMAETAQGKQEQLWAERLSDLAQAEIDNQPGAKALALVDLLRRSPADHALVFTGFRQTQDGLAEALREAGHRVYMFHGGMRRAEKEEAVASFAANGGILVTTESGGEGRNLQFCHCMVNYDLPWNPMRIEQRIGRIHRIGQTRPVTIYNLAAADTIEAHLIGLLSDKINLFELVVGELDMILGDVVAEKDFDDLVLDIWAGSADDHTFLARLDEFGGALAQARARYLQLKARETAVFGEDDEPAELQPAGRHGA